MTVNRHDPAVREKARRLYEKGLPPSDIAQIVGVPRQTINGWFRHLTRGVKSPTPHANIVKEGRKQEVADEQRRLQAQEDDRYSHFYNDPNVALLGDPPLHRSALGQKLREKGML